MEKGTDGCFLSDNLHFRSGLEMLESKRMMVWLIVCILFGCLFSYQTSYIMGYTVVFSIWRLILNLNKDSSSLVNARVPL